MSCSIEIFEVLLQYAAVVQYRLSTFVLDYTRFNIKAATSLLETEKLSFICILQVASNSNSIKLKLSPSQSECSSDWPLGKILSFESAIPLNPLFVHYKKAYLMEKSDF